MTQYCRSSPSYQRRGPKTAMPDAYRVASAMHALSLSCMIPQVALVPRWNPHRSSDLSILRSIFERGVLRGCFKKNSCRVVICERTLQQGRRRNTHQNASKDFSGLFLGTPIYIFTRHKTRRDFFICELMSLGCILEFAQETSKFARLGPQG